MPSLKDIAKICGVSVSTVSKALNGQKDIGEDTRRRICAAADEMGYVGNSVARALKTHHSHNLGMLVVDDQCSGLEQEYNCTVIKGFKAKAESQGYDVTFINGHISTKSSAYVKHCRNRGLDGVVVACVDFSDPRIQELADSGIPMVTIDHAFPGHTAILSDNINGVESLVRHAYSKGHRKIAYVHGEDNAVTQGRLTGFFHACRELNLEIPPEYVIPCAYYEPGTCKDATFKLLQLPDPPTCILFPDDFSFIGGHNAMLEAGYTIPRLADNSKVLSAMGYGGTNLARMIGLTTYIQNATTIGRTAADHLIRKIERPADTPAEQILVAGNLLEGSTVEDLA